MMSHYTTIPKERGGSDIQGKFSFVCLQYRYCDGSIYGIKCSSRVYRLHFFVIKPTGLQHFDRVFAKLPRYTRRYFDMHAWVDCMDRMFSSSVDDREKRAKDADEMDKWI